MTPTQEGARQALIENVEFITDPTKPREPTDLIAARLGYKNPSSLARKLTTIGRPDLARMFYRAGDLA